MIGTSSRNPRFPKCSDFQISFFFFFFFFLKKFLYIFGEKTVCDLNSISFVVSDAPSLWHIVHRSFLLFLSLSSIARHQPSFPIPFSFPPPLFVFFPHHHHHHQIHIAFVAILYLTSLKTKMEWNVCKVCKCGWSLTYTKTPPQKTPSELCFISLLFFVLHVDRLSIYWTVQYNTVHLFYDAWGLFSSSLSFFLWYFLSLFLFLFFSTCYLIRIKN